MNSQLFPRLGKLVATLALLGHAHAVTLDECVRAAREANPDAQAAEARIAAAREAVKQATSAYLPTVTLSSTIARTDNAPQAFFMELNQRVASMQSDFNNPGDVSNWRNSVGAKVRLTYPRERDLSSSASSPATSRARRRSRPAGRRSGCG